MDPMKGGFSLGIRERKDDVRRRGEARRGARGLGGGRAGQRGERVGLWK